jgi:hypothetical protein
MIDWLLELGAARVARPVLRGGGGSDAASLPNQPQKGTVTATRLVPGLAAPAATVPYLFPQPYGVYFLHRLPRFL